MDEIVQRGQGSLVPSMKNYIIIYKRVPNCNNLKGCVFKKESLDHVIIEIKYKDHALF